MLKVIGRIGSGLKQLSCAAANTELTCQGPENTVEIPRAEDIIWGFGYSRYGAMEELQQVEDGKDSPALCKGITALHEDWARMAQLCGSGILSLDMQFKAIDVYVKYRPEWSGTLGNLKKIYETLKEVS